MKFYFGSSWWCISNAFSTYMINYLKIHPEYIEFFKKSCCSDECFFQTLLMNSEFANTREEYLHYIDWSEGKSLPKVLKVEDLNEAFASHKLMARKIDSEVDKNIITQIIRKIGSRNL